MGRFWKWIEHIHTAFWLFTVATESALVGAAIAWIAVQWNQIPLALAIVYGIFGCAGALLIATALRNLLQESVPEGTETVPENSAPPQPTLTESERSNVHIRNRDVFLKDLIYDGHRIRDRIFERCDSVANLLKVPDRSIRLPSRFK
jgi:thiol:disulfide interchange protein